MITNERDLETYICENQEDFIESLKNTYGKDQQINFLGRQVDLGNKRNIADLVYFSKNEITDNYGTTIEEINFIIVELKFRKLQPKDVAQLSRYMNLLKDKLLSDEAYSKYYINVYGTFVSFGRDDDMDYISMLCLENISFIKINPFISFIKEPDSYYNETYIENLKIDDRIKGVIDEQ